MSGRAQMLTVARCLPSVEKNTILPGSVLGFDSIASATTPLAMATLLTPAP